MYKKLSLLIFLVLLICVTSGAKADLNSGTEDQDLPLDSITGDARIEHQEGTLNSMPDMADNKKEPKVSAGTLSVGIKKRADSCPRQAKKGDILHMHYRGTLATNGKEFDSSYQRGQPFVFTLGMGQVIKGWDQGLMGICAGEKRKLVIPPHLAYGESGSPPTIPTQSTLVFEVEAVKVESGSRQEL